MDDEKARSEGFLTVAYNVEVDIASLFKGQVAKRHADIRRATRMREYLPMCPSAIHFCYNDVRLQPFMSIYQQFIGSNGRVRLRAHFGSHTECQYALMAFGIMPDSLPVDMVGNTTCIYLNQWIDKQKILEAGMEAGMKKFDGPDTLQLDFELSLIRIKPAYDKAKFLWPASVTDPIFCLKFLRAADFNPCDAARLLLESLPCVNDADLVDLMVWLEKRKVEMELVDNKASSLITFPSSKDILLGRGVPYQNFPGNKLFIAFLRKHEGIYDEAGSNQLKKTAISRNLMHTLQESGARFLQRACIEEDGWVNVDDEAARKKVSHAFRNLRRRKPCPQAVTDESSFD
jgi:hypothetical protein